MVLAFEVPDGLVNPVCDSCNKKFQIMEELNVHMKNMHSETDSMRLIRLEKLLMPKVAPTITIIPSNEKLYDCSECGSIFMTGVEHKEHIERRHTNQSSEYINIGDKNINTNAFKEEIVI